MLPITPDSFREVNTRRDLGVSITVMSFSDQTAVALQPTFTQHPTFTRNIAMSYNASLGKYILFAGKEFTVFWASKSWTHNATLTQVLGIPEYQNPN